MKAWLARIRDNFNVTVVFAKTRGKARNLARYTDACDGAEFCDIEANRLPQADKYYKKGKTEMVWGNPQDRLALVKECKFSCEYADLDECETCSAREFCDAYAEVLAEAETCDVKGGRIITNREHLNSLDDMHFAIAVLAKVSELELKNNNPEADVFESVNDTQMDFEDWLAEEYKESE